MSLTSFFFLTFLTVSPGAESMTAEIKNYNNNNNNNNNNIFRVSNIRVSNRTLIYNVHVCPEAALT